MIFRFKLNEDLVEDMENKLKEEKAEFDKKLDKVRDLLTENGFEETQKLNGISFNKDIQTEDYILQAQMYIDTSSKKYSSYISSKDNKADTNFSSKGDEEGIVDATYRLITEVSALE